MRKLATSAGLVVTLLLLLFAAESPSAAAGGRSEPAEALSWSMRINGAGVADADTNRPVSLPPEQSVGVVLRATNHGDRAVMLKTAQLEGGVLGLDFLVYTTRIDFVVPADGVEHRRSFQFDLLGLKAQATGLLPARVTVRDGQGQVVVGRDFPVAIQGQMRSVYGVFGITVGAITLLLLASVLLKLATGRLHPNRWRRGMAFLPGGVGVGFTLTFSVSALAWLLPSAGLWSTFLVVGGVAGFVAGYLTPTPDEGPGRPPAFRLPRLAVPRLRQAMSLARRSP